MHSAEGEEDEECPRMRKQQLEHVYQFMRGKLGGTASGIRRAVRTYWNS